jgi:DNA repair protein RecO (recombination protein O)
MLVKTKGIVLHSLKYSDSSSIVKIYTRELGLQSYMIKGMYSKKSKTQHAFFQPLSLLELEVSSHAGKNLQSVRECSFAFQYQSIPFQVIKTSMAMFINEIIYKCVQDNEPQPIQFDFIMEKLISLDQQTIPDPDFHLKFLLDWAKELGFMPQDNYTEFHPYFSLRDGMFVSLSEANDPHFYLSQEESKLMFQLMQHKAYKFSNDQRKQLLEVFIRYYQIHVPGFTTVYSGSVWSEVFS